MVGKYIWNRRRSAKIRSTGKTVWHDNPPSAWEREDRPHLRIISDDLWNAVKKMQAWRRSGRGDAISKGIADGKAKRRGGADRSQPPQVEAGQM